MKEISEDEQWEIFELLEGNLNLSQQNELLQKIAKNPTLKAFHHSLKETYLDDIQIEYPHKNKLLKTKVIELKYQSFFRYAAAVVATIGIGYWYMNTQNQNLEIHNKQISFVSKFPEKEKLNSDAIEMEVKNGNTKPKNQQKTTRRMISKNIQTLKKFESKAFNPSTKLIEETEFFNQLVANQYLSSSEKKTKMLKWLILNTPNPEIQTDNFAAPNKSVKVEYQVVQQDILSSEEIEAQELNSIWVSEAKQMLKKGQIPKIKLISSKSEKKWLPKFDLEIQTNTASMVRNIIE